MASPSSSSSSLSPFITNPSSSNNNNSDSNNTDLQSALHFAVAQICRDEDSKSTTTNGGNNNNPTITTTSSGVATISELVYHYATKSLANDLVAFSRHANRRTVTIDDVKLVARKEKTRLFPALERFCEEEGVMLMDKRRKKEKVVGKDVGGRIDRGDLLDSSSSSSSSCNEQDDGPSKRSTTVVDSTLLDSSDSSDGNEFDFGAVSPTAPKKSQTTKTSKKASPCEQQQRRSKTPLVKDDASLSKAKAKSRIMDKLMLSEEDEDGDENVDDSTHCNRGNEGNDEMRIPGTMMAAAAVKLNKGNVGSEFVIDLAGDY